MPASRRTSREIEIKLPIYDVRETFRSLRRLRAIPRGRVFEQNMLYDTRDSDFRRRGWLLRLRSETPAQSPFARAGVQRAVLTFKAPPQPKRTRSSRLALYKERLEREVVLGHPHRWPELLASLGLHPGFRYEKYRTELRLDGVHLCLDETPIGVFLELEGDPTAIDRVAEALGYSPKDYVQSTYWDLYVSDARRRRSVTNMMFRKQNLVRSALFA
jgi:adenylate cyclase, class 2